MTARAAVLFGGLATILVALPAAVHGQSKPAPAPGAQDAARPSCVTSACHSQMGQARYVHGPVAAGECTTCHTPKDAKTMIKRNVQAGPDSLAIRRTIRS